jgi:hypothetical protein
MSRHFLCILILAPLSVLVVVGIALAHVPPVPPAFLDTDAPSIPANDGNTYKFWYTLTCPSLHANAPCECDNALSGNDCIAAVDTDGDGILDWAPDNDDDGVPDLVDVDYLTQGPGITESAALRLQESINTYVTDWNFRAPTWVDANHQVFANDRPLWISNTLELGYRGAAGAHHVVFNSASLLVPGPNSLVPHETWHKIQQTYYERGLQSTWVHEGQARSVQDKVADDLKTSNHGAYNAFLGSPTYTQNGRYHCGELNRSEACGLTKASYDAALWWTYFAEQFGDSYAGTLGAGMDAWRTFLEQADQDLYGLNAMDAAIAAKSTTSVRNFEDAYRDFVVANYAKELNVSRIPTSDLDGRDPVGTLRYRDEGRESANPTTYNSPKFDVDVALFGNTQAGHVNAHVPDIDVDETDPDTNEPDDPPTRAMPAYGARYY